MKKFNLSVCSGYCACCTVNSVLCADYDPYPGGHQQFRGNLLSSPDNGRMSKEEMNHAGMYLYAHNHGAGRETKNCGREHLRALPRLLSFIVS